MWHGTVNEIYLLEVLECGLLAVRQGSCSFCSHTEIVAQFSVQAHPTATAAEM